MKKGFRLEEKGCYRLVNLCLLVGIGLFGGGDFIGLGSVRWTHILTAFVMLLVTSALTFVTAKGRLLCLSGIFVGLSAVGITVGIHSVLQFFLSYLRWLLNMPMWQEEWVTGYEIMQTILLVLLGYLLQTCLERNLRIKVILSCLLLGALLYCLFARREISHLGVVFAVLYLAVVYAEGTQRHWNKKRKRSFEAHMLWIMPFLAGYCLLMALMPAPEQPYDWKIVKDAYQHLRETFLVVMDSGIGGNREDYSLNFSGFSENGNLGGNVTENHREIMTIRVQKGLVTNIYLTGQVFDTFDGTLWSQTCRTSAKDRYLDIVELLYAADRYNEQYRRDYVTEARLRICYDYFRSGYLFAPLKTERIEGKEALSFTDQKGALLFEGKQGYGTEYTVSYYQMNLGGEEFCRFLEADQESDDAILMSLLKNAEECIGETVGAEDLERYRQQVYEDYLGDVTLSAETQSYLEEITHEAYTNAEKLKAIEEELSSFAYTTTPGELPVTVTNESEFLDYFLMESRQGYCSYFATAFVLLARAQGIPARYVQGFCVPGQKSGEITVYSNMAHAWPEVYLDGVGWIPYEPTPGYAGMRYTPWKTVGGNDTTGSSGGYGTNMENAQSGYEEEMQNTENEEDVMELPEEMIEETADRGIGRNILRIIGWTVAAMLVFGLAVLLIDRQIGRWRYKRMRMEEQFCVEVRRNLRILLRLGADREEEETLEEWKNRAESLLSPEDGVSLHFMEAYEEYIYGNKTVDEELIGQVRREQYALLQQLKKKKSYLYRYYRIVDRFFS